MFVDRQIHYTYHFVLVAAVFVFPLPCAAALGERSRRKRRNRLLQRRCDEILLLRFVNAA